MAAQIRDDDPMPAREMIEHRLEHVAADHQPVDEEKRRPRPSLVEVHEIRHAESFPLLKPKAAARNNERAP
jgi:hypothetical protein